MVAPPEVVAGRYRLDQVVSSGPWGTLFEATDDASGERVAVAWTEARSDDAAFRREARSAGALVHPAIARAIDQGEHEGGLFVVSEGIEGVPLSDLLHAEGPIEPRRAIRLCVQVLQTLVHAHEAGLTHGGLDPAAVAVTDADRVKVVGFGLAQRTRPGEDVRAAGRLLEQMLGPQPLPELQEIVTGATDDPQRYRSALAFRRALEGIRTRYAPDDLEEVDEVDGGSESSVWPIPDRHYDAAKLGRKVIAAMVALALVAAVAFLWRVVTRANELRQQRSESPTPETSISSTSEGNQPDPMSVLDTTKPVLAGYADPARPASSASLGASRVTSWGTDVRTEGLAPELPEATIERMT